MTYRVYREHDKRYYEVYESMKDFALDRAGHECEACGATTDLHVHHIVPKSDGGDNSPNNLEVLCPSCHGYEHNKLSCVYCGNLVPVNPYNGRPYWERGTDHSPICYDCKEDPMEIVDYNVPDDVQGY